MDYRFKANDLREEKIRRNKLRRQRQLRRRMIIAFCALIIVIASSLGYSSFMSRASEAGYEDYTKVYISVMIPYGSTLEKIGYEYMDETHYEDVYSYIDEVKFINHLNSDKIIAGHYLILPCYVK